MTFTLAACGNNNTSSKGAQTKTEGTSDNKAKPGIEGKKILVVYFSQTGNTKVIADKIHENVGGDIFRIKTVKPYPTDYNTLVDQAKKEQENNYRPRTCNKS